MTNAHHTVLYTGVTNDLERRVLEHRTGTGNGFTKKYYVTSLVYFEYGDDVNTAIFRKKQIKAGSRKKKIDLINSMNPEWKDLFDEYFGSMSLQGRSLPEAIPSQQEIAAPPKSRSGGSQ